MKKLTILSMLLASQVLMAGVLPKEEGMLVVRAVVDSLNESKLICEGSLIKNPSRQEIQKAFRLNVVLQDNKEVTTTVSVDENERQPIITITREYDKTEEILKITTNAEINEVINLDFEQYETEKKIKNVGTLTKPKYEEVITRKDIAKVTCN